ncbi:MAG: hypothetical protein KGL35_13175 [Bradyrhizobium sp.]|nr:hypothetical protein [Bradyrhizobium sp.]
MSDKTRRNSTFLARIGFEDEDLRSPEHDQMSFFLASTGNFRAVAEDAGIKLNQEAWRTWIPADIWEKGRVRLEFPITKGSGQYSTIIGYADAVFGVGYPLILIEAKTSIPNPMETLRQLNTYKEFFRGELILWMPGIDENIASIFRSQRIFVSNFNKH